MSSTKATLRLSENMDDNGDITSNGADQLVETAAEFASIARTSGCGELMAFATSAVRDAGNSEAVLERVRREAGVSLDVLSGEDEARLTFLAVRRWYGWSAGNILDLDIGGGSLELTFGGDEDPEIAYSLQLGAGRLTRDWFREDPPGKRRISALRDWLDAGPQLSAVDYYRDFEHLSTRAGQLLTAASQFDLVVSPVMGDHSFPAEDFGPDLSQSLLYHCGYTAWWNQTGQPAMSIPMGLAGDGLPVGLQLVARRRADWSLLDVAEFVEAQLALDLEWPDLVVEA